MLRSAGADLLSIQWE